MNIFDWIYYIDISLICLFYLIGFLAIKKESKDTWGGAKTMEFRKSIKLSKKWTQRHPILDFFQTFYYKTGWVFRKPSEFSDNIKYFIQRGKKGYSKRDVWGFDYYLSDIIVKGLKDLKEMAHGYPCGMGGTHNVALDEDDKGEKKWQAELDKIIWTFEVTQKIQDRSWIPVDDENERKELKNYERRLNRKTKYDVSGDLSDNNNTHKYHVMTKKEMKNYKEGWELFQKYYFDLWD